MGAPGNALSGGRPASFRWQDVPSVSLQSKGKPDLEAGAVSLQGSLDPWKTLEPLGVLALGGYSMAAPARNSLGWAG